MPKTFTFCIRLIFILLTFLSNKDAINKAKEFTENVGNIDRLRDENIELKKLNYSMMTELETAKKNLAQAEQALETEKQKHKDALISTHYLPEILQFFPVDFFFSMDGICSLTLLCLLEVSLDCDDPVGSRHFKLAINVAWPSHEFGESRTPKENVFSTDFLNGTTSKETSFVRKLSVPPKVTFRVIFPIEESFHRRETYPL